MQSKYKIVLSLAQELGIALKNIQKYVQWYKLEAVINYDFVNGFSYELENDVKTFITKDYLNQKRYALDLNMGNKFAIQKLKSKITKGEVFTAPQTELQHKRNNEALFTIGYEGISIDTYINKLLENYIQILVDVRKNAYSNKFGFNKNEFQYCLERAGIKYIHIPELGINSEKRQELKTAKSSNDMPLFGVSQVKMAEHKLFEDYKISLSSKQQYIDQLLQIFMKNKPIAMTCFEADYKCCHRHILAEFLDNVEVIHL